MPKRAQARDQAYRAAPFLQPQQAEQLWSMLDDLAASDPDGYAEFIEKQMAEAKAETAARRSFRPEPGLVLRTTLARAASVEGQVLGVGGKVFVNLCHHAAVEGPRSASGREVDLEADNAVSASGLQIPLLVGEPRRCVDGRQRSAIAIDVVVNPSVHRTCSAVPTFLAQIMALVLRWIAQEAHVGLSARWKRINARYKGGGGPKKADVVPFPIDAAEDQSKPQGERGDPAGPAGSAAAPAADLASPQAVLRAVQNLQKETATAEADAAAEEAVPEGFSAIDGLMNVARAAADAPAAQKKVLIQEVGPEASEPPAVSDAGVATTLQGGARRGAKKRRGKKGSGAVKKGFLNSGGTGGKLYPKGSENGSEAGSYARLMSKCKVVDASSMTEAEQRKAMQDYATPPRPPQDRTVAAAPGGDAAAPKPFADLRKGFLGGAHGLFQDAGGETQRSAAEKEFDDLCALADPEIARGAVDGGAPAADPIAEALKDLAGVFDNAPVDGAPAVPAAPPREEAQPAATRREEATLELPHEAVETEDAVQVTFDLGAAAAAGRSTAAALCELDVSETEVRVAFPGNVRGELSLPVRVVAAGCSARFRKKAQKLLLTLPKA